MYTEHNILSAYMPYYKWSFKALRELPILSELDQPFEYLISSGNNGDEAKKNGKHAEYQNNADSTDR